MQNQAINNVIEKLKQNNANLEDVAKRMKVAVDRFEARIRAERRREEQLLELEQVG